VSRDGNIVSVTLNLVRADLTINNPDRNASPTGVDALTLRSYGGCKTGPVIEVQPGNTLRVDLNNRLAADDPTCLQSPPAGLGLPPGVGCFNTTNLHTHGLHVSPAGNSDNVLLSIAPQTAFPFEINIPSDHPSGTFWYHPHRHGSTAVQVASGAAGLLVVRGNRAYSPPTPQNPRPLADIDTILRDARGGPMAEQRFVFQQIAYGCFQDPGQWLQIYTTNGIYDANSKGTDPNSPANAAWTCPAASPGKPVSRGAVENFVLQLDSPTIWDTNGRFTSINGVVQPTMTIAAGEIQRWRFVHAGVHDTINLQVVRAAPTAASPNPIATSALAGNRNQQVADVARLCPAANLVPQFEIAADGLTRTKMRTLSGKSEPGSIGSNYLQPGYRSDVLIAFPEEGDYCLLDQTSPAAESANHGGRGQGPGGQGPSQVALLAYIHVRGGNRVPGDLETYVRQALYAGNPTLPTPVREGLRNGDLTPWAPFIDLPPAPVADVQTAAFAITAQKTGPPLFQINGKSYDPAVVNVTRQVNTTDEWLLTSSGEPHIFHIHINPFEVIDVTRAGPDGKQESIFDANGNCKASITPDPQGLVNQYCSMYKVFRDTIFVENDYQVRIRTRYDRYIGEFVIHCHILDHEDAGMMLNIQIVPDLKASGGGVGMATMKHPH
jgi:FtsP/CotA-like multicopper oxidase with cupredoxin domain